MNAVVTAIAVEHIPSFRAAIDIVAREKRYLAMVEAPTLEQVTTFVSENIKKGIAQYVALAADQVVGWADIVPAWAYGLSHRGSVGMGVLPPYRRRGIGRQLLEACIAKSWKNGLTRIELEVRSDNTNAIRLYERLGFTREGIKRQGMRIDGQYHDLVQMALLRHEA